MWIRFIRCIHCVPNNVTHCLDANDVRMFALHERTYLTYFSQYQLHSVMPYKIHLCDCSLFSLYQWKVASFLFPFHLVLSILFFLFFPSCSPNNVTLLPGLLSVSALIKILLRLPLIFSSKSANDTSSVLFSKYLKFS